MSNENKTNLPESFFGLTLVDHRYMEQFEPIYSADKEIAEMIAAGVDPMTAIAAAPRGKMVGTVKVGHKETCVYEGLLDSSVTLDLNRPVQVSKDQVLIFVNCITCQTNEGTHARLEGTIVRKLL